MITGEAVRSLGALKLEGRTVTRTSSPGVTLLRWCEQRPSRVVPSSSFRTLRKKKKHETMLLWSVVCRMYCMVDEREVRYTGKRSIHNTAAARTTGDRRNSFQRTLRTPTVSCRR